jgi:hypothetical protein
MHNIIYIYELSKDGIPFYIGKTINPSDRKGKHKRHYKFGVVLTIIDEIEGDKSKWKPLESYWIEQYKCWGFSLININSGGGGPEGFLTLEMRRNNSRKFHQDNPKYNKQYYQQNKPSIKEAQKNWFENNKEKKLNQDKQYYQQNKETKKEYFKRYYFLKKQSTKA